MAIFDHTDDDGDRIMITKAESGHWVVGIVGHQGDIAQMILDDEAIARLHKVSGPEIAPEAVREYRGLRPFSHLMPEAAEVVWPDDERRIAALKAAGELVNERHRTPSSLAVLAEWIMGAPWEKREQVQK